MRKYERPRVQTLNASQIVETLGPVQGYDGTGERGAPQSSLSGMPAGLGSVDVRN